MRVARETALRFRLTADAPAEQALPSGSRVLGVFRQRLDPLREHFQLDGSTANIRFYIFLDPDGFYRFSFIDYSHGSETEYARFMRKDLEQRIREADPSVELDHRENSGRAFPP